MSIYVTDFCPDSARRRDRINDLRVKIQHDAEVMLSETPPTREDELQALEVLRTELDMILEWVDRLMIDENIPLAPDPPRPGDLDYVEEVSV